MRMLLVLIAFAFVLSVSPEARAHKPSDSYLALTVHDGRVEGQWDIALRDLDYALGLDRDQDLRLTWGEVRAQHAAIAAFALSRLHIARGAHDCPLTPTMHLVDDHSDGTYAVLRFAATCARSTGPLTVDYRLFFDLDSQHKGLLRVQSEDGIRTAIFSHDTPHQQIEMTPGGWQDTFGQYFVHGVWHIWVGFDHLLFLCSLLLPAVLARQGGDWRASASLRDSLVDVARVVTAFTVAHSITLALAALEVLALPSRMVESAIAASVVLAACNNLYPIAERGRWKLAFAFGLIHGFGFAGVLRDLGLPHEALLTGLVAFNVGVEAGQLAVVGVFIPLVWRLRGSAFYRQAMLGGGSLAIAALALLWFGERAFLVKL